MKKWIMFFGLLVTVSCYAGDAELYLMLNEKSFGISEGNTEYILKFAGFDDTEYSGTAYLMWPDTVILEGYRYHIQKKMLLPFMVFDGTVGIDVSDGNGNVTTFDFIIDYTGALIQVCSDLRFIPKEQQ